MNKINHVSGYGLLISKQKLQDYYSCESEPDLNVHLYNLREKYYISIAKVKLNQDIKYFISIKKRFIKDFYCLIIYGIKYSPNTSMIYTQMKEISDKFKIPLQIKKYELSGIWLYK